MRRMPLVGKDTLPSDKECDDASLCAAVRGVW
jgi:hypothetical protein